MKFTKLIRRSCAAISGLLIYFFFLKIPAAWASLWDVVNQKNQMEKIGGSFGSPSGNPTDPRQITVNVIKVFLSVMGIVFVILIIIAGFKWMLAGGSQDKISEAKSQIRSAIIGLVIIICAWSITYFVTSYLLCAADNSWVWCGAN